MKVWHKALDFENKQNKNRAENIKTKEEKEMKVWHKTQDIENKTKIELRI